MASSKEPVVANAAMPHFILVPLAAQGHLIPMVDIAHLLANLNIRTSLITTPGNASRIRPIIDRARDLNLPINFVELAFPDARFGLPPGCESMEQMPGGSFRAFFDAVYSLSDSFERFLAGLESKPDCIIADMSNAWTGSVARRFGIPRVIFHGPSCFYISAAYNLELHKIYERVSNGFEFFTVPDFPVEVKTNKMQTPGFFNFPGFEDIRRMVIDEEATADGVVANTFVELEKPFVESHERVTGKRVWTIGPTCLYNNGIGTETVRGNKETVDRDRVIKWLDRRDAGSVIYANFGSAAYSNPSQLLEIACGLEESKKPFILVIKEREINSEVEKWLLSYGFEDRGLVLTGWVPQTVILSHAAVGGFMTHCGWNSVLESVSTGVPMITWPRFADQFLNERLVVDVLKIGVSLGVKTPDFGNGGVMVKKSDVSGAVLGLVGESDEARERRERVRELAGKARIAVAEGGSSWTNLADMVSCFVASGRNN